MKLFFFLIFNIMTLFSSAFHAETQTKFSFVNIENDISKTPISSLIQDHKGFMWMGTLGTGVYKFDGINYTSYTRNIKDSTSLSNNRIETSFLDSNNRLWFGTENGLNLYNKDLDRFQRIFLNDGYNGEEYIGIIGADKAGNITVRSYDLGVYVVNKNTLKVTKVKNNTSTKNTSLLKFNSICITHNDKIFMGSDFGLKELYVVSGGYEFATNSSMLKDGLYINDVTERMELNDTTIGWWSINEGDFDGDGYMDYVIGNNGLNYKYKVTENETFDIYVDDFDKNNIISSYYKEGKQYPVRDRECSSQQIPAIKQKFKNYNEFSQATLANVYGEDNLKNEIHHQVEYFASAYMENRGGKFIIRPLPVEAQLSSVNQILIDDYNKDGYKDALITGNLHNSEVETPRNDAGYGLLLKGDEKGDFSTSTIQESGFYVPGNVKYLKTIRIKDQNYIIAAKNNDYLQFIKVNK